MSMGIKYGQIGTQAEADAVGDAPAGYLTLSAKGIHALMQGLRMDVDAPALPIAAVRSMSTEEFPGHLAAVVYCGQASAPVGGHRGYSWHALEYFLARWCRTLSGVVLYDDEMVPANALAAAMHRITEQGFRLALYTPATQPDRLRLLRPFVDWVSLEVRPGAVDTGRLQSIDLLVGRGSGFECRLEWGREQDLQPRAVEALARRVRRRGAERFCVHADRVVVKRHQDLWGRLQALVGELVLRQRE